MGALSGRTAIITGAASGMGRATAILFAKEGANVVLADLNMEGGEEAAKLASAAGPRCVFQRTDVTSEADIAAMVARALKEFGRLDITFNNAGIVGATGPLEHVRVEDWDFTLNVCLRAAFLGIKHSVGPMRETGRGAIISTASVAGFYSYPTMNAYGAAKAGIINLTRGAAIQYAPDQIRINAISPGNIITPMIHGTVRGDKTEVEEKFNKAQPIGHAGQPDDIAQAALFLASDASGFITGHNLIVDGGISLGAIGGGVSRTMSDPSQPNQTIGGFVGPSFQAR
jgi:NAD(P)-dependent dehydrogenase (short-subunit alcohol dehydrogenase family)